MLPNYKCGQNKMCTAISLTKNVYAAERINAMNRVYHRTCFRCYVCKNVLKIRFKIVHEKCTNLVGYYNVIHIWFTITSKSASDSAYRLKVVCDYSYLRGLQYLQYFSLIVKRNVSGSSWNDKRYLVLR
ncbi:unnamed protein product [Echinostoma caproni]|uniref:LIM zinc-binding domain-containing protein n=1 Tax=Echinostoma caproni TaxID=27848 RepID=A0A183A848_9TREM|nr:unnamed protein product [Echinostoma caproni]